MEAKDLKNIVIKETKVDTVLTKSNLPIAGYSINPYVGCPFGCKYCYANQNPQIAQENYRKHNPNDLMILGNLKHTDEIQQSNQKSFLENNVQQKLF